MTVTVLVKTTVDDHLRDEWIFQSRTADLDLDLSEVSSRLDGLDREISSMKFGH